MALVTYWRTLCSFAYLGFRDVFILLTSFCDLLELEWGVRTKFPSNLIHCGLELFMQIITFYWFYALDFFFKVVVSSKRCWLVSFRVWYFLIFRSTRCFSVRWKTKMKLLLFLNKKLLQNWDDCKQNNITNAALPECEYFLRKEKGIFQQYCNQIRSLHVGFLFVF